VVAFSSCRQTMSGRSRCSHSPSCAARARIPFTFQVAILTGPSLIRPLTGAEPAIYYHLVMKPSGYNLDATFAALADPTRRAILARLATGEATVSELAEPFDISQPAISKHLKVLERAGLITRGQEAQRRPSKLEPGPLAEATDWI